ncbi:MAG: hypothetical protein BWZ08_01985 [candidate division BRC1 bacterium ADurb.BinA292]|nr:MAG: hypothetical protein BWZ08_01985 [candidate division BRC1 bacterium ADurb.BinA292]
MVPVADDRRALDWKNRRAFKQKGLAPRPVVLGKHQAAPFEGARGQVEVEQVEIAVIVPGEVFRAAGGQGKRGDRQTARFEDRHGIRELENSLVVADAFIQFEMHQGGAVGHDARGRVDLLQQIDAGPRDDQVQIAVALPVNPSQTLAGEARRPNDAGHFGAELRDRKIHDRDGLIEHQQAVGVARAGVFPQQERVSGDAGKIHVAVAVPVHRMHVLAELVGAQPCAITILHAKPGRKQRIFIGADIFQKINAIAQILFKVLAVFIDAEGDADEVEDAVAIPVERPEGRVQGHAVGRTGLSVMVVEGIADADRS